jgi:hypothetical protein
MVSSSEKLKGMMANSDSSEDTKPEKKKEPKKLQKKSALVQKLF